MVSNIIGQYKLKNPDIMIINTIIKCIFDNSISKDIKIQFTKLIVDQDKDIMGLLIIMVLENDYDNIYTLYEFLKELLNKNSLELYNYSIEFIINSNKSKNSINKLFLLLSDKLIKKYHQRLLYSEKTLEMIIKSDSFIKNTIKMKLRSEEWICFDILYENIIESSFKWNKLYQYFYNIIRILLWELLLSQPSFHQYIPKIIYEKLLNNNNENKIDILELILNTIHNMKICVKILSIISDKYKEIVISYFEYYNILYPTLFQNSIIEFMKENISINSIIEEWKLHYPNNVLCDKLKELNNKRKGDELIKESKKIKIDN